MFQRFSDSARRVVVASQEEARQLLHDRIGTEHVVLALCSIRPTDPVLTAVLPVVNMGTARHVVTDLVPLGRGTPPPHMPFDAQVKKVLEQAYNEMKRTGYQRIYPGHLLLAVLAEPESTGTRTLCGLGLDPDQLRAAVTEALNGTPAPAEPRPDLESRVMQLEQQVRQLTGQLDDLRRRLDEPEQGQG